MSTIRAWSPAMIAISGEEIQAVFADAFVMSADEAGRFVGHLAAHVTRRDFRFLAAREGEEGGDGPLLGFIYGYTGEPGQWFHDHIRAALTQEMAEQWLTDAYEIVEFGVRPEAQGRGIGGRLHDALIRSLTSHTAILSTRQGDTAAMRLYRRRGWRPLLTDHRFPSSATLYTIMGLDL
ncbi:MAG TPA: GNAT family N-acetyltransferase [Thermomicrobiales bacterium]|jgi:ribosomal protein S18 acetylase RimI-like enzyme